MSGKQTWSSMVGSKNAGTWQITPTYKVEEAKKKKLDEEKKKIDEKNQKLIEKKQKADEESKQPCKVCGVVPTKTHCYVCKKAFCHACTEYVGNNSRVCYPCAKVLGNTPKCAAITNGQICDLDLDPNSDYYHFWEIANDPNCPEYVMEYTYGGYIPHPQWLSSTEVLNLPRIASECGHCHKPLCSEHVVKTPTSSYSAFHTCPQCVPKIQRFLK